MTKNSTLRITALLAIAASGALLTSACGSSDQGASAASASVAPASDTAQTSATPSAKATARSTATTHASATTSRATVLPKIVTGDGGAPEASPTDIFTPAIDMHFSLQKLHWTSRTATSATATGIAHEQDSAVSGYNEDVTVKASAPATLGGKRIYSRLTITFQDRTPSGNGTEVDKVVSDGHGGLTYAKVTK